MFEINDCLIPSCTNNQQLKYAVESSRYEYIMVKMGDISTVHKMVAYIHHHGKKIMLHHASLKGISEDKYGLAYLKKIGVDAIITMKLQYIKAIKELGMVAILGCFVVDSASLNQTIHNVKTNKPHAMIVMPMTVPDEVYSRIMESCSVPVLAGGLGMNQEIIKHTLSIGVKACAITDLRSVEDLFE